MLDARRFFWQSVSMTETKNGAKGAAAMPKHGDAKRDSWPPQAIEAAREFKHVHAARAPTKLKGEKAAAIRRAVLSYYRG
jgi:hypothetical protein